MTTEHDLRRVADIGGYPDVPTILMRNAADEIDRLRELLSEMAPAMAGDLDVTETPMTEDEFEVWRKSWVARARAALGISAEKAREAKR